MLGTVAAGVAYFWLAALHAQPWEILVGSALLGLGIGLAFAAMANLVVDAVPQEQTGVATGDQHDRALDRRRGRRPGRRGDPHRVHRHLGRPTRRERLHRRPSS